MAYSGTHDNNTLLGYLFECSEDERRKVFDYCSAVGDDISSACETVIKTLLMSRAGTVVFPVQDLLAFGRDTRMNTPGTPSGNWAYRVTRDQLFSIDRERLLYLNSLYARK